MDAKQYKIQIPVQTTHLAGVRRQMESICERHNVPGVTTRRMVLAVDEALTNIIVHGRVPSDQPITLDVEIDSDQIVTEVRDGGIAFDPSLDRGGPDPKSFPQRGFGLYLIHLIADEIQYERTRDGRNVLKLFKTLH